MLPTCATLKPFQHLALIKKGLRPVVFTAIAILRFFQHLALIKKGLRRGGTWTVPRSGFQHLALIKKGLRHYVLLLLKMLAFSTLP